MRTLTRLLCSLALCLSVLALLPPQPNAQCTGLCGDANGSGAKTSADFIHLLGFLYEGDSLGGDPECADLDDYDLITLRDVSYINVHVFAAGPCPICPPSNGRLVPPNTTDYRLEYTRQIASNGAPTVLFRIRNLIPVRGVNLALQIRLDGLITPIDSVNVDATGSDWQSRSARVDPPGGLANSISAGFLQIGFPFDSGAHNLMTVYLGVTPAPGARTVSVDYVDLPPIMDDEFGVPTFVNYTMILDAANGAWAPDSNACIVWSTGDVNLDLDITSSDIITIVNYVFKSGPEPLPCPAAGDANCSGDVTSSDIISVVNFVFKGGSSPCDVCSLIPGTWSCP